MKKVLCLLSTIVILVLAVGNAFGDEFMLNLTIHDVEQASGGKKAYGGNINE